VCLDVVAAGPQALDQPDEPLRLGRLDVAPPAGSDCPWGLVMLAKALALAA
jgi:hypothetical protein